MQGNKSAASRSLEEALTIGRSIDDPAVTAFALRYLGLIADTQHDSATAQALLQESFTLFRTLDNQSEIALALMYLGDAALVRRDNARAQQLYQESTTLLRQLDNKIVLPYALRHLGYLALWQGNHSEATRLCSESLTLNLSVGERQGSAASLVGLAAIAVTRKQWVRATRLLSAANTGLVASRIQLLPFDHARYDETAAILRVQLDALTLDTALATGQAMTTTEVLGYALEESETDEIDDKMNATVEHPVTSSPRHPVTPSPLYDWGEMPTAGHLVGRSAEIVQLQAWLEGADGAHCRLLSVLGMGGTGKTTLTAAVVKAVAPVFETIIWRSLLNAPPFAEIVQNWLQTLSRQTLTNLPDAIGEQLRLLLTYLRQQRSLLVLDNLESILQPDAAGEVRPGYEGYAQLLQHLAGSEHQSVLLLTSREQPQAIARFVGQATAVQVLHLAGLDAQAGQAILQAQGLNVSVQDANSLVNTTRAIHWPCNSWRRRCRIYLLERQLPFCPMPFWPMACQFSTRFARCSTSNMRDFRR